MFYSRPANNSTLAASNILMRRVFAVSNKDGFHLYSSTKTVKTPWSVSIDDCDIHSYANLRFSGWQVGFNNADSVTDSCGYGGSIQISGSNLNCIAGSGVAYAGTIQPGGTLSTVTVRSSLLYCLDNNLSGTLYGPVSNVGGIADGLVQISPDCLFNPYSMTSSSFIGVAVGAQSQIFGSGPPTLTQTSAVGSSGTCSIVGSLNYLNTDSDKAVSLSLVPSGSGLSSGVFAYLTLAATAGNTPSAIRAIIQDDNPEAGITASDFAIGQIASGSNVIPLTTSAALTTGTTVGLTVIIVPP